MGSLKKVLVNKNENREKLKTQLDKLKALKLDKSDNETLKTIIVELIETNKDILESLK